MAVSTSSPPSGQRGLAILALLTLVLLVSCLVLGALYLISLDRTVRQKFEGKRWEIPAKVYSRPLELYQGADLTPAQLQRELKLLNYRTGSHDQAGSWEQQGNDWYIHTRGFDYGDHNDPEQVLRLQFANGQIHDIQSTHPNGTGTTQLEPILIGGIYPRHNEDRVLIQLKDVPRPLLDALIATEDRQFFNHHGISVRGLARAVVSNTTGGTRQGGSTLTQQLVKNFYLTPERTLRRKANEALMAVLLELHYDKNEILETYLNEINLGQNGNHSINGFGLAAQFYYGQPLRELDLAQSALLVGLVKGPSQYNPWRNPQSALNRRNTVLDNMLSQGMISDAQARDAKAQPLGILKKPTAGQSIFPDFLDVVRRQLSQQYQDSDLRTEGLRIFSSLNPTIQEAAQQAFEQSIRQLEKTSPKRLKGLQGALVVANPQNGELEAVVGGQGLFTGFNRALDARRQVGSLFKPAVYLTALQGGRYNLASPISDEPITITGMGMKNWSPKNYDLRSHGIVPLYQALANSFNQSTVRLGWELGIPQVTNTLRQLGIQGDLPTYPSMLLGAANVSPLDMLSMYQTFAAGGVDYPTTAIRSVVDSQGRALQRAGFAMRQRIDPADAYQINYALQQVVRQGTAKALMASFPEELGLAGKTGTTNDLRDAWFAGYSGNHVAVVWLGHDDNRPIGLTGGSGALPVWTQVMKKIPQQPVNLPQPGNIQWQWLDAQSGQITAQGCPSAVMVPVVTSRMPTQYSACAYDRYSQPVTNYGDTENPSADLYAPDPAVSQGIEPVERRVWSGSGSAVAEAPPPPQGQADYSWYQDLLHSDPASSASR